ncbi:DUF4177 domain-containing protein [Frigidibacter sp. MR17.24]|uniref:DUF4177 domain-containing protein n=1 Tax=Frigidibacter sp. MR17.24 TaxID=3127345 RepID=UPI003012C84B
MQRYEYKVVPAPARGEKVRGLKTTADRFAHVLTELMNTEAAQGWEYVRSDTLPCEERTGLTGRTTTYQNLLTFRRPVVQAATQTAAQTGAATVPPAVAAPVAGPARVPAPANDGTDSGEAVAGGTSAAAAARTLGLVSALKARAQTARPVQPAAAGGQGQAATKPEAKPDAKPAAGAAPGLGTAAGGEGSARAPALGPAPRGE